MRTTLSVIALSVVAGSTLGFQLAQNVELLDRSVYEKLLEASTQDLR